MLVQTLQHRLMPGYVCIVPKIRQRDWSWEKVLFIGLRKTHWSMKWGGFQWIKCVICLCQVASGGRNTAVRKKRGSIQPAEVRHLFPMVSNWFHMLCCIVWPGFVILALILMRPRPNPHPMRPYKASELRGGLGAAVRHSDTRNNLTCAGNEILVSNANWEKNPNIPPQSTCCLLNRMSTPLQRNTEYLSFQGCLLAAFPSILHMRRGEETWKTTTGWKISSTWYGTRPVILPKTVINSHEFESFTLWTQLKIKSIINSQYIAVPILICVHFL